MTIFEQALDFIQRLSTKPLEGWEDRLRRFKEGQTTWLSANGTKTGPTPLEWVLVETDLTQPHGFRWRTGVPCSVSGEITTQDTGVRCARCGVALHHKYANMAHSLDIPKCPRCAQTIRRFIAGL